MKDELNIQLPKEEDFVAANMRRDKYALTRDVQALEFNKAIMTRLMSEDKIQVKCTKCGKEFTAEKSFGDSPFCPACK